MIYLYSLLCIFLSKVSPLESAEIPVVPFPPTMVKQPPHEQLFQVAQTQDEKDNPFMLECEAQGNPELTYRWIKNGLEFDYVAYDKRISQQPGRGTLVFTKPEDIDEGLYQCFATNRFGTSVSNAVFLRKAELNSFLDVEAKEKTVSEGDPLSLNCNPPTGYPRPKIFWMLQSFAGSLKRINSSRITVDPEGDLHFSNVTKDDDLDDEMYACSATSNSRNEYKFGSKIILKVDPSGGSGQKSYRPVKQYVSPPNVVALKGQKLELSCIFGGTPLPEIKWNKRGSEMYSSKYTYTNFGKTLQIRNVDFDDAGSYECVGSNGVGTPITHAVTVAVHAIPYWITSPDNKIAAEEEFVRFVCDARAFPEPKLQWLVNGEPLEKAQPNPRRKLEGNTLIIEQLEKSDTAVYQCNASNIHGYAFKDFYLNVLSLPPTITEEPAPLTKVVVTSLVTITCRVFGAPKPEVRWFRGSQELSGGRYQVLDNGDLQISNALVTDQGMYTCSASNPLGSSEAKGKLEVKSKTLITQPPENFEVGAGNSATFRCNAESDSSLMLQIQWLFNGQLIDFDQDPRMVQASDNSLMITKTLELDSGVFTCVAKTELDQDEAQAILTVQVTAQAVSPTYATCRSGSVCIPLVKCLNIRSLPNWLKAGETCGPGPFALRQVCCSGPTLKPSIRPYCGQSPFYYEQNKSNEEKVVDSLEGQWPWMVGLFVQDKPEDKYKQICSGFLIDSRHVISAASCFKDIDDKKIQYQARIGNIYNDLGETYLISRISVPESFKSPLFVDNIAVLTLDRVVDSSIGRPICLPDETISSMNLTGTTMTAAGWIKNRQRAKIMEIYAHENSSAPLTQLIDNDTNTCSSLEVKRRDTAVTLWHEKPGRISGVEMYLLKGTTVMHFIIGFTDPYFDPCSTYNATLEKSQWVFLHCSKPYHIARALRISNAENEDKKMTICEIIVYAEDDPEHRLSLKHQMQKPVWSNKECNSVQRRSAELVSLSKELPRGIDNGFICTGFRQGHCDPFTGGPLMFKDRGRWFAVGISGTQIGCGINTPTSPALYVRISEYIDFIKDNTKD